jgi:hypothetical protein
MNLMGLVLFDSIGCSTSCSGRMRPDEESDYQTQCPAEEVCVRVRFEAAVTSYFESSSLNLTSF